MIGKRISERMFLYYCAENSFSMWMNTTEENTEKPARKGSPKLAGFSLSETNLSCSTLTYSGV